MVQILLRAGGSRYQVRSELRIYPRLPKLSCGHWRSVAVQISRSQKFITVQDFIACRCACPGIWNHYKFVFGAGHLPAGRQEVEERSDEPERSELAKLNPAMVGQKCDNFRFTGPVVPRERETTYLYCPYRALLFFFK